MKYLLVMANVKVFAIDTQTWPKHDAPECHVGDMYIVLIARAWLVWSNEEYSFFYDPSIVQPLEIHCCKSVNLHISPRWVEGGGG